MTRLTRTIARIVLATPALSASLSAMADDPKPPSKTISVSGTGRVTAPPTVADIHTGVVTQAPTARAALADNNARMAALQAVLKERGVASKDVQTSQISVQPQYSQPPHHRPDQPPQEYVPKIVGYQVTNSVSVTARDLSKLGDLLDSIVNAGANQMNGVAFRIDQPDALMDVARKKAMADAKKKAELMAGEAGVVVGFPLTIRDEPSYYVPSAPDMVQFRGMAAAAAPAPMPVAAGEQELSVTVQVVYELNVPKP